MKKNWSRLILTAVAVGTGIAVLVLNILGNITPENAVTLLAVGVVCMALAKLEEQNNGK